MFTPCSSSYTSLFGWHTFQTHIATHKNWQQCSPYNQCCKVNLRQPLDTYRTLYVFILPSVFYHSLLASLLLLLLFFYQRLDKSPVPVPKEYRLYTSSMLPRSSYTLVSNMLLSPNFLRLPIIWHPIQQSNEQTVSLRSLQYDLNF